MQSTDVDDHEARLETAADVSIARQISVSRQQRQLLIPIKATSAFTSTSSPSTVSKHNQKFPSPLSINMNRLASPLGAVASAARAESPIVGKEQPVAERKASKRGEGVNKTLTLVAASVKPSTPTLVVVGGEDRGKAWGGKAVDGPVRTGSGEITAGLAVEHGLGLGPGHQRSRLGPGEVHGHSYRKSERVVVERVSVSSN